MSQPMDILQLTPGAGEDFYCENCLRDVAAARALRARGHAVHIAPLYLPASRRLVDEPPGPVFLGGVNLYLQQKLKLFRRTPRWLDAIFDSAWLLRRLGRRTGMTDARLLGEMTLSMLQGPLGQQKKEIERLLDFLAEDPPQVVILSNALLLSLAGAIRRQLGSAVLCWLQDEDHFLDELGPPWAEEAWQLLSDRAADVDTFLAPTRYYADRMIARASLPADRIHVVDEPVEIPPDPPAEPAEPEPPRVGYLSQFSQPKGFDTLVEALALLQPRPGLEDLTCLAVGGLMPADKPFFRGVLARIDELDLNAAVGIETDFSAPARSAMLRQVDLLVVPTTRPEASAPYLLEALAAGVPAVLPAHGGQAELIERTGGGVLYPPGDLDELTAAIELLLGEPDRRAELARAGQAALAEHCSMQAVGARLEDLCRLAIGAQP